MDKDNDTDDKTGSADEKLLERARKRHKVALDYWSTIYDEADRDMEFCYAPTGQWDERVKADRKSRGLPSPTFNEVGPIAVRVTNDIVKSRPQISYIPVDDKADPDACEVLNDLMRSIEHRIGMDNIISSAVKFQVGGGIGWFHACTDYCDGQMYQDIELHPVINPRRVLVDPRFERIDGSDMKWGFLLDEFSEEEFEDLWPDAEPMDFDASVNKDWVRQDGDEKFVIVATYYE